MDTKIAYMNVMWPKTHDLETFPLTSLEDERSEFALVRVTKKSKQSLKSKADLIGKYFARELRYESPGVTFKYNSKICMSYLICEVHPGTEYKIVGGLSFRLRNDMSDDLKWLWLHPYYRQKKLLHSIWPILLKMHPQFLPQAPYSRAMQSFLQKYYPEQICPEY